MSVALDEAGAASPLLPDLLARCQAGLTAAQKALDLFAPVGFYQGDVTETRPWFLRSAA